MPPNNFSDFQSLTIVAYLRSMAAATADHYIRAATRRAARQSTKARGLRQLPSHPGRRVRAPDPTSATSATRAWRANSNVSLIDTDAEVLGTEQAFPRSNERRRDHHRHLLNEDKYSVQILDSNDRLVSVKRANLRESAIIDKSPMPSYKDKLSHQELSDLVSYLVSLKGVEIQ